jgi:hypothetical protein
LLSLDLSDVDLLFGKHRENTGIVFSLFVPLDGDSNKVLSLGIFCDNLRMSMNTFGTPETGVVPFS